jgi:hypothetical protein
LWDVLFGDRSVALWTVVSGVVGVVSALVGWLGAANATENSELVTSSPNATVRIVYSPVPSPVVTISPTPVVVTAEPSPAAEPTDAPPAPTDPSTAPNTDPSRLFLADRHVSQGWSDSRGVSFNNKPYDHSANISCSANGETTAWLVAGYERFTTVVGIADDAPGAVGTKMNISFSTQDNQPLGAVSGVSLGHPKPISFLLKGTVQMQVRCQQTGAYSRASLGNAVVERAQ